MAQQEVKRLAIFAHFDKHNLIDDYVIIYLEKLKEVIDDIIFVSDCNLEIKEIKKIEHLILNNICQKHGEYDFGSYKRGFFLLKEQYPQKFEELDELVFANDSCYAIEDFKESFKKSKNLECDAWSLGDDFVSLDYNEYYLQSYFIVFKESVFKEDFFSNFIKEIKKLTSKNEIINQYEIGLSRTLTKNNRKIHAVFSYQEVNNYISKNYLSLLESINKILQKNPKKTNQTKIKNNLFNLFSLNYIHSDKYFFLIKMNFPLLKRATLNSDNINFLSENLFSFWREIINNKFYEELIKKHLTRIEIKPRKKPSEETFFETSIKFLKIFIKRKNNFFQYKKTKSGYRIIKVFRIPIYHSKLLRKLT